jgi:hypothetical protein
VGWGAHMPSSHRTAASVDIFPSPFSLWFIIHGKRDLSIAPVKEKNNTHLDGVNLHQEAPINNTHPNLPRRTVSVIFIACLCYLFHWLLRQNKDLGFAAKFQDSIQSLVACVEIEVYYSQPTFLKKVYTISNAVFVAVCLRIPFH